MREYMVSAINTLFRKYGFEGMKHDFWSYSFEDSHNLLKNKDKNLINKLKEKVIFNQKLMKNDNIPIKRLDSISKENIKINEILKILE